MPAELLAPRLSRIQRASIVGFGVAGIIVFIAMLTGVPEPILRWLKFIPIVALALVAAFARPSTPTKLLATLALALSAVGDAFFLGFLDAPAGRGRIAGIATFSVAYLFLIAAFWRGRPTHRELRFMLPLAVLGLLMIATLWQHATPLMRIIIPIFTLIITTMAWTTLATRSRRHFPPTLSRLIAPVGPILVASDIVVALHVFHPAFTPTPLLSELFVRVTYLTGWLLVFLVILAPHSSHSTIPGSAEPVEPQLPRRIQIVRLLKPDCAA